MVPSAMAAQGKKCCLVSTLALHMEFFFLPFLVSTLALLITIFLRIVRGSFLFNDVGRFIRRLRCPAYSSIQYSWYDIYQIFSFDSHHENNGFNYDVF